MTASVATFLALLGEGAPGADNMREDPHLLSLAGTRLLDWLLDRAEDRGDHAAVLRWLLAALANNEGAAALLERPGAPARLLQLATREPALSQALSASLVREPLALPREAAPEDVGAAVGVVAGRGAELRQLKLARRREVQRVALQLLTGWASTSIVNCTAVAEAGVGPALIELAATSAAGSDDEGGVRMEVAALMRVLATECPLRRPLQMQAWLYQLLCFAADAAADGHWPLADASLRALAAVLLRGVELPPQLLHDSALPLLERLAAKPEGPMRPAIALVLRAMVEGGATALPGEERERWAETLLAWLLEDPLAGGGEPALAGEERRRLVQDVVESLAALAAPAGAEGLHIAHSWLAELITHLSRQVQPFSAVAPPKPPAPEGRRWYQLWGGSGSQGAAPAAMAPAPAGAAAAGAHEPGMAQAPLVAEEARRALASAASTDTPVPALEGTPPAQSTAAADGGGAPAASSGGWWRGWWPFGSGGVGGGGAGGSVTEGAERAAAEAASRPSDSELSLYINAAPVGPIYARAVAAELVAASGRVGASLPGWSRRRHTPFGLHLWAATPCDCPSAPLSQALCTALNHTTPSRTTPHHPTGAYQEPPPSAEELMSPEEVQTGWQGWAAAG